MEVLFEFVKEIIKPVILEFKREFYEYIRILDKIYLEDVKRELNIPISQLLDKFSLTEDKLDNPLCISDILELAKEIKENNFNFFKNYWKTHNYHHHDHGYRLKEIIFKLEMYSDIVEKFKDKYLEDQLISPKIPEMKEPFLELKFADYNLPHYQPFIDLINKSAHSDDFYIFLPFQLRCLFENLLYDTFFKILDNSHKNLYYLSSQHRPRDFSQQITLLNVLKDIELKQIHKGSIEQEIITILKQIQKKGNLTAHNVIRQIDSSFITTYKQKIERCLLNILTLNNNFQGEKIKISDSDKLTKIYKLLNIKIKE